MSLTVGNVNAGTVAVGFAESLARTIARDPGVGFVHACSPYVSENRNAVVEAFLGVPSAEWLLMVDSDISWMPDQIDQLVASADEEERPVVSGLYFHPLGDHDSASSAYPVAWGDDLEPVEWRRGGMQRAAFVGSGFLLLHRSALRSVSETFERCFDYERDRDGAFVGEDIVLCRRLARLDLPVYVNCDVVVAHLRPVGLVPDTPVEPVVRMKETVRG